MPIRSTAVGRSWSASCDLTARWALAYAAALDFPADPFLDDAPSGGPPVAPGFCVCMEWLVAGSGVRDEILGNTAAERRQSVHAMQDSVFHHPMSVGTGIEITARVVRVARVSAGSLVELDITTLEAASRRLLVSSRFSVIFRGVETDGEASIASAHPPMPPAPGEPGLADAPLEIPIARGLPHTYSECARIWNPIHTERQVALAAGLPDIILHGTATWGLAARELMSRMPRSLRLLRHSARFRAPVVPGNSITLTTTTRATGKVGFTVAGPNGTLILSEGYAEFG